MIGFVPGNSPRRASFRLPVFWLAVLVGVLIAGFALAVPRTPARAAQTEPPPFGLPFSAPSGPSTWYLIQYYGNTTGAYRNRFEWYGAGQGLHFGLDFAAPCGTPVLAIGDGIVTRVDVSYHGALPHNLMILHPNGYASFYGHLLETASVAVGQEVHRGEVVALTGDPDLTCRSRPHLHLEIRNATYSQAFNPIPLIDADWNTLALFGPSPAFQRDLDNPRRWVTPFDQPDVQFGGPMLNDYGRTWPPDW